VLGVIIILIPNAPLILITLWSQIINGLLLPVVLVCMILIVNKKKIMGKHINKPIQNIIGWSAIAVLVGLSVMFILVPIFK
jgi:Mn2+/Fe2+ NRAMP family transporter